MRQFGAIGLAALLWSTVVIADEAPITGTIKSVDVTAQRVIIESTAKGKTRQVTVEIRPTSKIVRFVRSTDPTQTGFTEQPLALTDIKPGWTVTVKTHHDGDREVAETVKVVLER
jgi:hypothetical protein